MSDTGPALDPREQMLATEANKVVAYKAAASAAATAEKKRVAEEAKKKRQEASTRWAFRLSCVTLLFPCLVRLT